MEEKNELNDIILNRSGNNGGMKKVMLVVATLTILLIIVITVMGLFNSDDNTDQPRPVEVPKVTSTSTIEEDPLFEPVTIDKTQTQEESLDDVAKKIKEQSQESELISGPDEVIQEETVPADVVVPAKYEKPVKDVQAPAVKKVSEKSVAAKGNYYIQVGSFGRYAPDKKFLQKITDNGYTYKLHKIEVNGETVTKLLIGPYATDKLARKELKNVRSSILAGAFLFRI